MKGGSTMTTFSPSSPNPTESVNPSRVPEIDVMQTEATQMDLLATPATTDVAQATAYPIVPTPTHIVHVSTNLMPAHSYPMLAPPRAPIELPSTTNCCASKRNLARLRALTDSKPSTTTAIWRRRRRSASSTLNLVLF